ncbi:MULTISPECIES: protein kinase domain-containing protein [Calothrix]|uniref:non-specific serine/threonine protein kinase n=2 Tax=Calothrix TaxID=1186 RepID=A0ABR8AJP7_9CYAN|nr:MULTISPECIES: IMS domain-containing protein [Calothrix]MBD2200191.1 DUF4101 domain-containing protein [Calothrix parietina FACHB-288]MBD2229154.1 DUF4101 domain-containing protein [Calothrix anomala FACHB-343]
MSSCILTDQLLNDRYKIIRPLGIGGMGQTYIAEDTQRPNNPLCVVKQLKPASSDPSFLVTARRLFNGEAEILEKLGRVHDQIPQLLAYFETEQEFYLVQDFVDGHPLSSEMLLGERWSESQVIQLLKEVLTILETVHCQGVIHRDIKPDNLIRRQDGKLCLIDFGAVKQIQIHQASHSQMIGQTIGIGTPGYMPTEQSKGKPRPSSDLYALGMVVIQALTGILPSQLLEDKDGETIWCDQAEVSAGLASFLKKMVRYHFKERFETATEALQALHQITASQSAASSSGQLVSHGYQQTVEVEQVKNATNQASIPVAQSEDLEELANPQALSSPEFAQGFVVYPQPHKEVSTSVNTSSKQNHLLLGIGVMLASCLLTGGSWFFWQHNQQQNQIANIKAMIESGKYDQCLDKTNYSSKVNPEIYKLLAECQLGQAKQLAAKKDFKGAMTIAEKIPSDTSAYSQITILVQQWSDAIIDQATELYKQGKFNEAVAVAKSIPQKLLKNPQKIQELTKKWSDEWEANNKLIKNAQVLLNLRQWQSAINEVKNITLLGKPVDERSEYWNQEPANIVKLAKIGIRNSQTPDPPPKPKEPPVTAPIEGLSQQETLDLINKWLEAKPSIFATPFDRQLAASLTTGKIYEDITKPGGTIDWLQQEKAYYRYGTKKIDPIGYFSSKSDRVEIEVQIRQGIDYYVNEKLKNSEINTSKYRFVIVLENGKWKLSDRKEIK